MTLDYGAAATPPSPVGPQPSFLALRARPEVVRRAREFAATGVFGHPYDPYEISLLASELVTNAVRAARTLRDWDDDAWPISVQMTVAPRYAHLAVTDPDHRPMPAADEGGVLAEHGRGLTIVDQLATARWVHYEERSKTVHAVVSAPGVELTSAQLAVLRTVQ